MGDAIRRIREPLSWLLLGITAFIMVIGVVRLGWDIGHGMDINAAARSINSSVGLLWVLLDLGVVLWCLMMKPPVRRSPQLVTTAAVIVSVVAAYDLFLIVTAVIGGQASVIGRILEAIGGFFEVILKVTVAVILWRMRKLVPRYLAQTSSDSSSEGGYAGFNQNHVPVWRPDQAVGTAWTRAGDATSSAHRSGGPVSDSDNQLNQSPGDQPIGELGSRPDRRDSAGTRTPRNPRIPRSQPSDAGAPRPAEPEQPRQNWTRGGATSAPDAPQDRRPTPARDAHQPQPRSTGPWLTAGQIAAGQGGNPETGQKGQSETDFSASDDGHAGSSGESTPPRWAPLPPDDRD